MADGGKKHFNEEMLPVDIHNDLSDIKTYKRFIVFTYSQAIKFPWKTCVFVQDLHTVFHRQINKEEPLKRYASRVSWSIGESNP